MMRSTDTPRLLDAVKRILDQAVEDPDLVPLSGRLETLLRVSVCVMDFIPMRFRIYRS